MVHDTLEERNTHCYQSLIAKLKHEEKNTVWCTDFTYIKVWDGLVQYNCSILVLSEQSIVATKTIQMMTSSLSEETIETAQTSLKKRPKDLILLSEQGSRFASYDFKEYCIETMNIV